MKTITLILLLVASFSTSADSIWKDERTYLWTASTVAILADWGTTLDIENHPDLIESNRFLGENPSRADINKYFFTISSIHIISNIFIENMNNRQLAKFLRYTENFTIIMNHGIMGARTNFYNGLSINF